MGSKFGPRKIISSKNNAVLLIIRAVYSLMLRHVFKINAGPLSVLIYGVDSVVQCVC